MKVGITLPQFRDDAEAAIVTARAAEDAGLDGVFVFDHLWPIGRPERPVLQACFTLLGAIARRPRGADLGPLVAASGWCPRRCSCTSSRRCSGWSATVSSAPSAPATG